VELQLHYKREVHIYYCIKKTVMGNEKKVTSKTAASAASKVLRDRRTSTASKTAAGSALSQRPGKRK